MFSATQPREKETRLYSPVIWALAVWAATACSPAGATGDVQGRGAVDSFVLSSTSDGLEFTASGWAGAGKIESRPMSLEVKLGDEVIYDGQAEKFARPDVVAATGRKDWARSGWRVTAAIPRSLKNGTYDLQARAIINDGSIVSLAVKKQAKRVMINRESKPYYEKIVLWLGLFVTAGLFYVVFLHGDRLSRKISEKTGRNFSPVTLVAALIGVVFAGLVSFGLTGSSLEFGYKQSPFIEAKTDRLAFSPKPIRSDEWLVLTPLAIGQANHQPPFPVVNRNLGEDGQNMLVVGMTGAPVNHLTLLAKPATWGFHLFDLKRALAWYWWFPPVGCLLALWWLFGLLLPGRWRLGLLLSSLFCLSPYVAARSFWPVYAVFFPSVALCSALLLLRERNRWRLAGLAVPLGLSIAGFVLLLYPPWQITLGFLYLAIAAGLVLRDREYLSLDRGKLAAFVLAGLLAGVILWSWWTDSRPAIEAMLDTVYPGKRSLQVGGGVSLSVLLRGFTNIVSLYGKNVGGSNPSAIASFPYLFLPLLVAMGLRLWESRGSYSVIVPIAMFAIYTLVYMAHGVPQIVSQLTLWSRVPSIRADLALGLSYVLLCGLVLAGRNPPGIAGEKTKLFIYLVSLVWTIVVAYAMSGLPKGVLAGMTNGVAAALLLAVFLSGVWLMTRDTKKFMALSLAIFGVSTLPFNPLSVAPEKVCVASEVGDMLAKSETAQLLNTRVLVLENQAPAMALMSAGIPTINGVLYHPQMSLWRRLGVDETLSNVFNRYQHQVFTVGRVETAGGFNVESSRPDVVRVVVDAERFNFGSTGAGMVAVPQGVGEKLGRNLSVRLVLSGAGWSWFEVTGVANGK